MHDCTGRGQGMHASHHGRRRLPELSAPATTQQTAWMTGCRPSRCNVPDRRMSAALLTDLQVNYSPGVVKCGKAPRLSSETHMFVDPPKNNLQAQAIWIHQPTLSRALLPREFAAPPSHSWVEVSHCYYSAEGVYNKIEPMWFFAAPGSGLFLNVGRTVHLDIHLGGTDEKRRERIHRALAEGNYYGLNELINGTESDLRCWKKTRAARCFKSLKSYDSMIFPLRKWRTWGHELWTEIVLLHRGAERTFVSSALDWLRCGDFPRLRKCSPTDAAVRMQGPSCIRAMDRFAPMREILSKQNCSIGNKKSGYNALQMSVEAEAIANDEVERLTAQYNLSNNASVEAHETWLEGCPSCARFPFDVYDRARAFYWRKDILRSNQRSTGV